MTFTHCGTEAGTLSSSGSWSKRSSETTAKPTCSCCVSTATEIRIEGKCSIASKKRLATLVSPPRVFLAIQAFQEIEVWALAGIDWRLKPTWTWKQIQNERDPKEHYLRCRSPAIAGLLDSVAQGRRILGDEAGKQLRPCAPELSRASRARRSDQALAERFGCLMRRLARDFRPNSCSFAHSGSGCGLPSSGTIITLLFPP